MSASAILTASCAVLAYGASAGIEIELPNGRRVSPAAAFGPALAALGTVGYEASFPLLLFPSAIAIEVSVVLLRRRRAWSAVLHAVSLLASFGFILLSRWWAAAVGVSETIGLLAGVVLGSLVYYAVDVAGLVERPRTSFRSALAENARATLPLSVVMMSTAGLIVLVLPRLGWASFAVMFLPVLAARHEFARYGKARRTFHQTVRALGNLAEGAGYLPSGHHARVAGLCLAIGNELGLPSERVRELELVGLLHDVGAVSVSEPAAVPFVEPEAIAKSSGQVLEETGYLAKYAPVLIEAIRGGGSISLEARILRMADAYDRLNGSQADRLRVLGRNVGAGEEEVFAALGRVTERA